MDTGRFIVAMVVNGYRVERKRDGVALFFYGKDAAQVQLSLDCAAGPDEGLTDFNYEFDQAAEEWLDACYPL